MEINTYNTTEGLIDLHIHTNYSSNKNEFMNMDLYPEDLLSEIKEYTDKFGCHSAFAITDHDNILGAKEVYKIIKNAPEKYKNITFIPGCEFYVTCESLGICEQRDKSILHSMHLLGYNFNINDKVLNYYSNIKSIKPGDYFVFCNDYYPYGSIIIAGKNFLNKNGSNFSLSDFLDFELKTGNEHLYVENVNRFYDYCETKLKVKKETLDSLYNNLLGLSENYFYKRKKRLDPKDVDPINTIMNNKLDVMEIMSIIENAGGVSVLAHPNLIRLNDFYTSNKNDYYDFVPDKVNVIDFITFQNFVDAQLQSKKNILNHVVRSLVERAYDPNTGKKLKGLMGIELLHSTNIQQNFFSILTNLLEKYNLYATGGSDKHGSYNKEILSIGQIMPSKIEEVFPKLDKTKATFSIFGCKFVDDIIEKNKLTRKYGNHQIDMLAKTSKNFEIFDYRNIKRFVKEYGIREYSNVLKKYDHININHHKNYNRVEFQP